MANQWFRLYAEFATDPKVQMMSEADQRRFIMVLCLRCSNDDVTLHDDEVAFQLRISSDEWERSKAVFLKKGLINEDNTPTAWDKRQFVSDSSAERVRRHRANKKKTAKQVCNVTEAAPEADTDTDTEAEVHQAAAAPPPARTREEPLAAADPPDPIHVRACELTTLLRPRGARLNATNPDVRSWAERGVTDAQLLTAFDLAEERRAAKRDPSPVNAGLLTAILGDLTANAGGGARASPAARKANAMRDQNREAIDRAKARIMAAESGRDGMHDGEVIDAH